MGIDLPGMLPLYALYFRGKSGSGTVSSKIEAVGTRKALNYQYPIPAPGGGWYWGNATMVLTPRGWVDVMIVGDVADTELSEALDMVAKETGREVTPVTYRPKEFRRAIRQGNSFVTSVLRKPKIMLKGDEDALQRLG